MGDTITVTIGGSAVRLMEGSFALQDAAQQRSVLAFQVLDVAGTQSFPRGGLVQINSGLYGNLYTGLVNTDDITNDYPNPLLRHTIKCMDNHWFADKLPFVDPEFINMRSGDIVVSLLNLYLANEGITANYAMDRDTTQAELGEGTLTNVVSATNVDDGDLELALAGTPLPYEESTTLNFSTGTLAGVTAASNTLALTSTPAIKFSGTGEQGISGSSNGVLSVNRKIWAGSFNMLASDVLVYDVWIAGTSPEAKATCFVGFSDGTYGDGVQDYEGLIVSATTDLSAYAKDQWYTRYVGGQAKTVTSVILSFGGSQAGDYAAYYRNIRVLSSSGALKQTIFNGTLNKDSTVNVAGYANVKANVVTSYERTGSRISAAISVDAVNIVRQSQINYNATVPAGTAFAIDGSIDNGATWQEVPNHNGMSSLLPGMSVPGRSLQLRERFSITGSDPTVTPVLHQVLMQVDPSYKCIKSDIRITRHTQAGFALGTKTNVQTPASGSVQLVGVQENWDEPQTVTSTISYPGFGTTYAGAIVGYRDYVFQVDGTSAGDARVKFDTIGQWADFTADIDLLVDTRMYGLVYRTTSWVNTDGTFAYAAMVSTTEVRLEKGSNSTGNSKSTLATVPYSTTAGGWHRMRVIANGNNHKIYIDDVLYINHTDNSSPINSQGYIGGRIYNPLTSYANWFGDNFGVVQSLTGTWTDVALSLNSLGSISGSIILWDANVPDTATLDIQTSIDGGTTWTSALNGGTIAGLTAGASVVGVSVLTRAVLTATEAGFPPQLNALTVWVMGAYSASGTRISPSLSLGGVGRAGNSSVSWNANTPTGATLGVDTSIDDGTTWNDISTNNGGPIFGIAGQPDAALDQMSANTGVNYISTNYATGTNASWTFDTANNRLSASGGVRALYLWNQGAFSDGTVEGITNQSDASGLVFRYQNNSSFYSIEVNDASASSTPNTIQLLKRGPGTSTIALFVLRTFGSTLNLYPTTSGVGNVTIASASIAFVRGTYHTLKVEVVGTTFKVYFDGVLMITATDTDISASGSVGFRESTSTAASYWYQLRSQPYGQSLAGVKSKVRLRLASTDPTVTPQVLSLITSIHDNSIDVGALIASTNWQYQNTLASCMDDLCSKSANGLSTFWWNIDKNKQLFFQSRYRTTAPFPIQSADILVNSQPKLSNANPTYRNRSGVIGGLETVTLAPIVRVGDGYTQSWALPYPIAIAPLITLNNPLVKLNNYQATVGILGVDSGKDFYYQSGSNIISQDPSKSPPAQGETITFTPLGQVQVLQEYDDLTEQQRFKALEGGSGIVGVMTQMPQLSSAAAAAFVQADVQANELAAQTLTFQTLHNGLAPGQLATAFVPQLRLNNVLFFISQVDTVFTTIGDGTQLAWYSVTAITGPNLASWTHLLVGGKL